MNGDSSARAGVLGCDDGERYASTIYNDIRHAVAGIDIGPWHDLLDRFGRTKFPEALMPDAELMH